MCDVNKKLLIVLLLQIVFIAVFYTFGFLFLLLWVCIPFTLSSHQLLGHFRHSSNISLNFWDFLSTNPTSQFFFCFFFHFTRAKRAKFTSKRCKQGKWNFYLYSKSVKNRILILILKL